MNREININGAWSFVFHRLFCDKTKLIYDYLTDTAPDGAFRHLPTFDEIKNDIPNRCGWFSGMEDGDISGGIMLDATLLRYERTGEEKMIKYANDLYEGLMANATLSESKGFLIRSRHPKDGVSHYGNSSRDQYTHWIASMLNFYKSPLSTEEQRKAIADVLVEFAKKAERDVTAENAYSLLDEKGKPALVSLMYGDGVRAHESLRLAMMYVGAYAVTKDSHWKEMYHSVRDFGVDLAERICEDRLRRPFALVQMQLSVKLVYEYEEDKAYKDRLAQIMKMAANVAERYIFDARDYLKTADIPEKVIPWRECPEEFARICTDPIGYKYVMPDVYEATCGNTMWMLRNAADAIIAQGLCTDRKIKSEQLDAFYEILDSVQLDKLFNHASVSWCLAYELVRKNGNN